MGSLFLYYIVIIPMSRLPLWFLYRVSDLLSILFFYLIPYRKKVVLENLRTTFTQKSQKEINTLCRNFYHHLADLLVENIKGYSLSDAAIRERFVFQGTDEIEACFERGENILFAGAHFNNWEWISLSLPFFTRFKTYATYQPMTNPIFDRKFVHARTRTGMNLLKLSDVSKFMEEHQGTQQAVGFFVDQSPGRNARRHWMTFLGRETPVQIKLEVVARRYNLPVFYAHAIRKGRGRYVAQFVQISKNSEETQYGEITEALFRELEKGIQEQPAYWLWSHRRWKLQRGDGEKNLSLSLETIRSGRPTVDRSGPKNNHPIETRSP